MIYGVIADTHNYYSITESAIKTFEDAYCDRVVHCGDFNSHDTYSMFWGNEFLFGHVTGNHDNEAPRGRWARFHNPDSPQIPEREKIGYYVRSNDDREKIHIGAIHGTYKMDQQDKLGLSPLISSGEYDFLFYGHYHFFNIKFPTGQNKTCAINPGSFYRHREVGAVCSIVTVDTDERVVSIYFHHDDSFTRVSDIYIDTRKLVPVDQKLNRHFFSKNLELFKANCQWKNEAFSSDPPQSWLNRNMDNWEGFFAGGASISIGNVQASAKKKSGHPRPDPGTLLVREIKGVPFEFVYVPYGPLVSRPMWVLSTPVTQAQYYAVMKNNPSHFEGEDLPVERVSLESAKIFCYNLSVLDGKKTAYLVEPGTMTWKGPAYSGYQLLTKEAWMHSCLAGDDVENWSPASLDQVAWYSENSEERTHPVGQKEPNHWGLYDMLGNVREWCVEGVLMGGSFACEAKLVNPTVAKSLGKYSLCSAFRVARPLRRTRLK